MSRLFLDQAVPAAYDKSRLQDIIRAICGQINKLSEGAIAAKYNAQSTVPSGTSANYAVGDFVPDSNCTVTNGNLRLGWICVAAGTPGTLKEARVIVSGSAPTRQVFTSGSGTYTTPAGCTAIEVELIGGGGGGGGSATSGNGGAGGGGGTTTFGASLSCSGGNGGAADAGGSQASGGTASGGDINIPGGFGGGTNGGVSLPGGLGGGTPLGPPTPGTFNIAGTAGVTNSGAGGSGGSVTSNSAIGGGGGGGAYLKKLITSPNATYSYAVGGSGTAGTAGTGGKVGGAGAAGIIIVTEFYN